jgi:hypothetical protein
MSERRRISYRWLLLLWNGAMAVCLVIVVAIRVKAGFTPALSPTPQEQGSASRPEAAAAASNFEALQKGVQLTAGPTYTVGDLARLIREQTGAPVYVDARYHSVQLFLSKGELQAEELVDLLGVVLGLKKRPVGSVLFLGLTEQPLLSLTSSERLRVALKPELAAKIERLGQRARELLTVWTFSEKIPLPKEWFDTGASLRFRELSQEQQAWIARVMHNHPGRDTWDESVELATSTVDFRDTLWLQGEYGSYYFVFQIQ